MPIRKNSFYALFFIFGFTLWVESLFGVDTHHSDTTALELSNELIDYDEQDVDQKLIKFTPEEAEKALSDLKKIVGEKKFEEARKNASENTRSENNFKRQTFSIGVSSPGNPNNIIFSIGKRDSEPKQRTTEDER